MGARDVDRPVDAVVVGGGPAGSAVGRLLAAWGWDVAILAGPLRRRPSLAESLPPSCRKPLAAVGILDEVEAAGFLPNRGNLVAWAGEALRSQTFDRGDPGFQVLRERFDELLLDTAEMAGARVVRGSVVRRVELQGDGPDGWLHGRANSDEAAGGWGGRVTWDGVSGRGRVRARWILDCSGRAGILARRGLRVRGGAPATLALVGVWREHAGWPLDAESHTIVESYRDGWAWSVPVERGRRCVATMVDPRQTTLSRRSPLSELYTAELRKTRHLGGLLTNATREGRPWACVATTYGSHRHAGPGFLLVGDAGSFLDPLSSFGVKKALASGWLAAVVVHTCLAKPSMQDAALALFEERERAAQARHGTLAHRYYAEAAAWHEHPFWTARAQFVAELAEGRTGPPTPSRVGADPETFGRDARVAAAFDHLRRTPAVDLRPAADLRHVLRPTVQHREVVLAEHLATPAVPEGIRFLHGIELPKLVEIAHEHEAVSDLYEAYRSERPAIRLPEFLGALSTLVALGMLEAAPGATGAEAARLARPRAPASNRSNP